MALIEESAQAFAEAHDPQVELQVATTKEEVFQILETETSCVFLNEDEERIVITPRVED